MNSRAPFQRDYTVIDNAVSHFSLFRFQHPSGGIVYGNNRFYVADERTHSILVIQDAKCIYRFGGEGSKPGLFRYPSGLAIDPKAQCLAVADRGNDRIQIFSLQNYDFIDTFGETGRVTGQLHRPQDVAYLNTLILVADTENHRIQAFDMTDEYRLIWWFGQFGTGPYDFQQPCAILRSHSLGWSTWCWRHVPAISDE